MGREIDNGEGIPRPQRRRKHFGGRNGEKRQLAKFLPTTTTTDSTSGISVLQVVEVVEEEIEKRGGGERRKTCFDPLAAAAI